MPRLCAPRRVIAFGWMAGGPVREIIETANLDGWVEGPGFGMGINQQQFASVLAAMQQRRKMGPPYIPPGEPLTSRRGCCGLPVAVRPSSACTAVLLCVSNA